LAALDDNLLDARLYIDHASNILDISESFNLLLTVIVSQPLTQYKDAREFLAILAKLIEPVGADRYIRRYGEKFEKRFNTYRSIITDIW
jgi:hypothetical protein